MDNTPHPPPEERPVLLLVGAGLGIGRAIARLATARGFALAACDIDVGALDALRPELAPDAGSVQGFVHAALARFGRIDAVISNAGGMISLVHEGTVQANIRPFSDIPARDWKPIIDLNLYGPMNVAHAVLPAMLERGHGRIVFISSVSGLTGGAGLSVYAAAKGAVHAFAKSLAREVTASGVSVNCVAPGAVATRAFPEGSPSIERRLRSVSIGRLGQPEEIAEVAVYVAMDAPQYLSGEIISVSGGPP